MEQVSKHFMHYVAFKGQRAEHDNMKHPRIRVSMYIDEHKNDDLSQISMCSFGHRIPYMQNVALRGQGAEQTLPHCLLENSKVHPRIRVCMYIDEQKKDDLSQISMCSFGNCASYFI